MSYPRDKPTSASRVVPHSRANLSYIFGLAGQISTKQLTPRTFSLHLFELSWVNSWDKFGKFIKGAVARRSLIVRKAHVGLAREIFSKKTIKTLGVRGIAPD